MGSGISSSPKKKDIFILSGQSNMSGRGGVTKDNHWDHVVPPECRPDPNRIFRLNSRLKWEIAQDPLHADIDTRKVCGVGPGMPFANAIGVSDSMIGLVPCAVGGTAIKEWSRGTRLYQNMIKRAKFAARAGEIRALVWYQGESDTSKLQDAEGYRSNMEKLIQNVRLDLDSPLLPVIQVAIASGEGRHVEKVREAQKSVDFTNVVCVDAMGLPLKEDKLHLTTEAQVKLGLMLGRAYLKNFASEEDEPFHSGPYTTTTPTLFSSCSSLSSLLLKCFH